MKNLSLCILTLAFSLSALGQVANPEFTKIAKKFESGKFESALESAEALIDNDKHRKKPEPYLWASMCYYGIYNSDDEKLKSRFRSSLRDALKYAGKAVQKDKNGNLVENNPEYFETMKREGVAFAQEYERDGEYRKSLYTYKQLLKIDPSDPNLLFVKGITDLRQSAAYEAERAINASLPILTENYRDLNYQPDPISSPLVKDAMIYYIDHLVENAYVDSARNMTMAARVFFPLDEDIKSRLQDLK